MDNMDNFEKEKGFAFIASLGGKKAVYIYHGKNRTVGRYYEKAVALKAAGWVSWGEDSTHGGGNAWGYWFEPSKEGLGDLFKLLEERYIFKIGENYLYVTEQMAGKIIGRSGEIIKKWSAYWNGRLEIRIMSTKTILTGKNCYDKHNDEVSLEVYETKNYFWHGKPEVILFVTEPVMKNQYTKKCAEPNPYGFCAYQVSFEHQELFDNFIKNYDEIYKGMRE